jgi:hypothetical protein
LASQGSFAALAQMEEDKKAEKKKKKEKKVPSAHPQRQGYRDRRQGVHGLDAEWVPDSRVFYVFLVRLQEKADKEKKEKKVSSQAQKPFIPESSLYLHSLALISFASSVH